MRQPKSSIRIAHASRAEPEQMGETPELEEPTEVQELARILDDREDRLVELEFSIRDARATFGWRILDWLGRVRERIVRTAVGRCADAILRRTAKILLDEGWAGLWTRSWGKLSRVLLGETVLLKPDQDIAREELPQDIEAQYPLWLAQQAPISDEERRRRVRALASCPVISLVGLVTVRDLDLLRAGLDSLRAQAYPYWDLTLVTDDGDDGVVRRVVSEAGESRIRVHLANAPLEFRSIAGEFFGFLDACDRLAPDALLEVATRLSESVDIDLLYTDEDRVTRHGRRLEPFFKPDWSPDLLLSSNYIGRLAVVRRSTAERAGGIGLSISGSGDYDLYLRLAECGARIEHLPKVLYHRLKTWALATSARKHRAEESGRLALVEALRRRGHNAQIEVLPTALHRQPCFVVRYPIRGLPLVSILIPMRNKWELLDRCLKSIGAKTLYRRYEVIVIDNQSDEQASLAYLESIADRHRVLRFDGEFNFAKINNFASTHARGDYLLFLNNDAEVIHPEWLTVMLEHAQRPEVGAVGAKLLYPDGSIQHAGVVIGIRGMSGHVFRGQTNSDPGDIRLPDLVRNCSAVTAACVMVPRRVFEEVGGFDERLRVDYNDIDLCLRIRRGGYLVVYAPRAVLLHQEAATRRELHPPEDHELFRRRWAQLIERGDPYYNPNLTLAREDGTLRF
jgi:GT2 family glycosyltransferase